MSKLSVRELPPAELASLFPLVNAHNPSVSKPVFARRLKRMVPLGYRAIGVYEGKKLVACSGFWLRTRFWCGNELDIDNFIVHEDHRRKNLGVLMLDWFEKLAKKESVELIVLDTYADAFLAHRFYARNGFVHTGYHMTKRPGTSEPFQKKR